MQVLLSRPANIDLGGGGGGVRIVTNMRNILTAWDLQQFVIILKKSTDIFSMIVIRPHLLWGGGPLKFCNTSGGSEKFYSYSRGITKNLQNLKNFQRPPSQ